MKEAINRLNRIISGFGLLSLEEQVAFIQHTPKTHKLYSYLQKSEPSYYFTNTSFALRNAYKQSNISQEKALELLHQHPMYLDVIETIFERRLQALGIPTEIFSVGELCILRNLENFNLESFLIDTTPQILAIKNKLKKHFDEEFGFLFKTNDLKYFIEINKKLSSVKQEDKNIILKSIVQQDWGNYFNTMLFLRPIRELFTHSIHNITEPFYQYIQEMQSAHLFYRFFGISSDHMILGNNAEYSFFPFINIFDYSLYHSNRKSIQDAMNVLHALFKPLKPFFNEYVEMAQTEKNLLSMIFRAFMPFFIMSLVLSLGYAAVLPLAYHQLIEYMFFIPAFYFSIVFASQYIQLKNYLYLNFVQFFYGSIYKTEFFTADVTLIRTFQSEELAIQVAEYYSSGLEQCDKIEQSYHNYPLNTFHIDARQANIQLKKDLSKEWRIFKTSLLPIEKIASTFAQRLHKDRAFCRARINELIDIYFNVNDNKKDQIKSEFIAIKSRIDLIYELQGKVNLLDYRNGSIEEQYETNRTLNI